MNPAPYGWATCDSREAADVSNFIGGILEMGL